METNNDINVAAERANRPTSGKDRDTKIGGILPRFSGSLEDEFLADYFKNSLNASRFAILLGIFLYGIFGFLDPVIVPEVRNIVWVIRYAIVIPTSLFIFLLTFTPFFRAIMQVALSLFVFIAGLGIIAMIAIARVPGNYLYYAGLFLCLMYAYTFIRLRFLYASATGVLITIFYEATGIWISHTTVPILLSNSFFLISADIIGMSAAYLIEVYFRKNFLQKQTIESQTHQLVARNEELVSKNNELAQSAQRTELVFAALTEALSGTILDSKYRLEKKIGSGGFGTVYKAVHLLLERTVAVKVFRPSMGCDPVRNLERFQKEGISACRINHRNAVFVLDFGVCASSISYMVMEFLDGWPLREELEKKGTLSVSRCAQILAPICSALTEAHAMGIVHRDINPNNIFLHHEKDVEVPKVVDFGIAKLMGDVLNAESSTLTAPGSLMGTPAYMAPERFNNKPYDGQTDVYSLGVVIYEMLCGCLPFPSPKDNPWTVVLMHLTHTPMSPRKLNPEIPEDLENLMVNALSRDPQHRPTAKEMGRVFIELADRENARLPAPGLGRS